MRALLWQVTAFTVAHAVTLALGTLGLITLPQDIVEPLIALSIAWVAIENILTSRLHPWRPAVVFGFGLLHGLGFAGVLSDLGLPDDERLLSLLTFNLGIEIGQLSVIALALVTANNFGWPGWVAGLAVAVMYTVLRQLEDYFVIPNVVGRVVHVHPLVALFAIFAGLQIWGITGMIIALPTAGVARVLLGYAYRRTMTSPRRP